MRAVVQRVKEARVSVEDKIVGEIGPGLVVLLGVQEGDEEKNADYLVDKISHLRIFEDENGKMNRSLRDVEGELLVVSQFTLLGDCRKGRRPSFGQAAKPQRANELYQYFTAQARATGLTVETGQFQAEMEVELTNHGPVTLLLDTRS